MVSNNSCNNWEGAQNCTFLGASTGNLTGSGTANIAVGDGALDALTTGSNNVGVGLNALGSCTTGIDNVAIGSNTLNGLTTSVRCVAIGFDALQNCDGTSNVGLGYHSGQLLTSGTNNLCLGTLSLNALLTGSSNVAIGASAGANYTGSESSNVLIGQNVTGTAGESNAIRIGTSSATLCVIGGISGKTSSGGVAVLVNASGVLGTITSSIRFKEDVENMEDRSSRLLQCRPVTFFYKDDADKRRQYGMIAEEVEMVMPELVVHDAEGRPEAVRYEQMICMLVNEVKKLSKRVKQLEGA